MEVPFALSIHKFVNSIGADAGFAAFICVAVIGLLYFAQARETATLRERLEDAHERIGGLEARIAQLMHLQSTRQPGPQAPAPGRVPQPARVTPPPAGARPMGSAIASVRRIPSATAAAAAPAPGALFPVAPVGMGAPALASATKLIPDPVPAPGTAAASDDTIVVPGPAGPAANGKSETPVPPAAIAPRAGGGPTPPRVQIRTDGNPSAPTSRRAAAAAARPPDEARFDVFEQGRGGSRSRFGGRRLPFAIGMLALVVIIGGLVAILESGNNTTNSNVHGTNTTATTKSSSGSHKGKKHQAPPFTASTVTVAVLNGTAVQGLAADVAKVLSNAGYKKGSITNAASQAERTTTVYFRPGYKADALHVATQLKLKPASVQAATAMALQACATTPTGTTTSCSGNVIVSAGQDKASLANSASSSAG
jgi:hypothetical protein